MGIKGARADSAERGSSVVTFVVALPLMLLFLFAIVDVGRTVFLHMALADAAHAACAVASEFPAREADPSALHEAAMGAAPSLAKEGLWLEVSTTYGQPEEISFTQHVYDRSTGAFEKRKAQVERTQVRVEVVLEGRYLTPLGSLLSAAEGGIDKGFSYHAHSEGVIDVITERGSP